MLPPQDDEPQLPDRLHRDLKATFGRGTEIPAEVDERLRLAAAARFRRPRAWIRRAAVAAAALLIASLAIHFGMDRSRSRDEQELAREDFDRNGRVDVLDAYGLALRLRRGDPVAGRWDLDGDGRVDRFDVDVVARRAVSVHGERK